MVCNEACMYFSLGQLGLLEVGRGREGGREREREGERGRERERARAREREREVIPTPHCH